MANVVLVTGVSRYLGGLYARRLSHDPSIERILGVDVVPPRHSIGRAEFVRADIRNPMIGRIMSQAGVDTVVHMNVIATPKDMGGRVTQKEINVIGTMQLLAACQKSESVTRLVVKSSAAVYGSSPKDPAMFSEDMSPKSLPRTGFGKDSVEVEGYVRGFSRRRPDVEITMLRLANVVGPTIHTSITDYFSLPIVPIPLGFDARFQLVHEDDAIAAMILADDRVGGRHRQRRRRRLRHRPAVHGHRTTSGRARAAVERRAARRRRQAQRTGRLLLRPAHDARLRPGARHDADAHGPRFRAALHEPVGLRGLRPPPATGGAGSRGGRGCRVRRGRRHRGCHRPRLRQDPAVSDDTSGETVDKNRDQTRDQAGDQPREQPRRRSRKKAPQRRQKARATKAAEPREPPEGRGSKKATAKKATAKKAAATKTADEGAAAKTSRAVREDRPGECRPGERAATAATTSTTAQTGDGPAGARSVRRRRRPSLR